MYQGCEELVCRIKKNEYGYYGWVMNQDDETLVTFSSDNFAFIVRWALFVTTNVILVTDEIDHDTLNIRIKDVYC